MENRHSGNWISQGHFFATICTFFTQTHQQTCGNANQNPLSEFFGGDNVLSVQLCHIGGQVLVATVDSETGAELSLQADDQYTARQSKIGYYGSMEEGRMVLDKRAVTGIVV